MYQLERLTVEKMHALKNRIVTCIHELYCMFILLHVPTHVTRRLRQRMLHLLRNECHVR